MPHHAPEGVIVGMLSDGPLLGGVHGLFYQRESVVLQSVDPRASCCLQQSFLLALIHSSATHLALLVILDRSLEILGRLGQAVLLVASAAASYRRVHAVAAAAAAVRAQILDCWTEMRCCLSLIYMSAMFQQMHTL